MIDLDETSAFINALANELLRLDEWRDAKCDAIWIRDPTMDGGYGCCLDNHHSDCSVEKARVVFFAATDARRAQ